MRISSELVEISSELVEISSELVLAISELLIISVFKISQNAERRRPVTLCREAAARSVVLAFVGKYNSSLKIRQA